MFCIFHMRALVAVFEDERKKEGGERKWDDRWMEFVVVIASANF